MRAFCPQCNQIVTHCKKDVNENPPEMGAMSNEFRKNSYYFSPIHIARFLISSSFYYNSLITQTQYDTAVKNIAKERSRYIAEQSVKAFAFSTGKPSIILSIPL